MNAVSRLTGWALRFAAGLTVIVLVSVIALNVFMRYVLGNPLTWAEEVTRYTMVYMAYIAAPLALREGRHIRITVLTDRLRGKLALLADMLGYAVVGSFAAVVVWHGWDLVQLVGFQLSPALRITMAIPYFGVVLGSVFLFIESLLLFGFGAARLVGAVPDDSGTGHSGPASKGVDL